MKIQLNQAAADAIVTRLSPTEERGDFGHHISDLTACLRKRWLDHNKPADGPNQLALTFLRGSALHQLLSGEASEAQFALDDLIGTVDHIDTHGGLWEWKTTMIWAGKLDDPSAWPESWLMQVAAYVYMNSNQSTRAGDDDIIPNYSINVGILHLQGDGRSNRLAQLRVYKITFTPEELAANWLTLRSRSATLLAGPEPAVTTRLGQWECKFCAHLPYCLPELKQMGEFPRTVRESPDVAS